LSCRRSRSCGTTPSPIRPAAREHDRAVIDLVREVRPPFSPEEVVAEFAETIRRYGCRTVMGDHYAGLWPRERFAKHGIGYVVCEESKSDLYQRLLPLINSRRVELLDHRALRTQLARLERKTSRLGKDTISHPPNEHDDVANSCAGAARLAAPRRLMFEDYQPYAPPAKAEPVVGSAAAAPPAFAYWNCPRCGTQFAVASEEEKTCRSCSPGWRWTPAGIVGPRGLP
jgi:hypothetical protein